MKFHLPKLLYAAVMAALTLPAMGDPLSSADIATPVEGGASYLNVGIENDTDTWDGNLVVGDTDTSQGDVDYIGAFNESWGWVTPKGGKTNTTITSGLKVNGSLTVQGGARILLGGQYMGGDSYTGLEATGGITVTGGTLTSTKITTTDLNVSGGTISTHTGDCTSGNRSGTSSWYLKKKSYIQNSLTISGGSLSFGYTSNVQGIGKNQHSMTAFGSSSSFTMTQTGGTMRVYGDCDLKAGATITQKENAGLMVLRDTVYMGTSGTTTFNQNSDSAKLVVGRLESTSSSYANSIVFDQTGDGLIHLAYGSNFAKESTISLIQSGSGKINLGGGHDINLTGGLPNRGYGLNNNNGTDKIYTDDYPEFESIKTTYKIDQSASSGSITIAENASITAEELTVGKDATLTINGSLTVTGTSSLIGTVNVGESASFTFAETADMAVTTEMAITTGNTMTFNIGSTTDADGAMQMGEGGDLAFSGGTFTLELEEAVKQEMAAGATLEGTEYALTLISNLSDSDIAELSGVINGALTLQPYSEEVDLIAPMAEGGTNTTLPITIVSTGLRLQGNSLQATFVATNPNQLVPEPTTATLSLLALAALAMRRRRSC